MQLRRIKFFFEGVEQKFAFVWAPKAGRVVLVGVVALCTEPSKIVYTSSFDSSRDLGLYIRTETDAKDRGP